MNGELDQNDCGSLVVDLLNSAGLGYSNLGVRKYIVDGKYQKIITPEFIYEDLNKDHNPVVNLNRMAEVARINSSVINKVLLAYIASYLQNKLLTPEMQIPPATETNPDRSRAKGAPSIE